jgi:hypothetical protein
LAGAGPLPLPPPPPPPLVASTSDNDADFVASATFSGARPGFIFQAGPLGVGYYREGSSATAGGISATTYGTILPHWHLLISRLPYPVPLLCRLYHVSKFPMEKALFEVNLDGGTQEKERMKV